MAHTDDDTLLTIYSYCSLFSLNDGAVGEIWFGDANIETSILFKLINDIVGRIW